MPLAEELVTFHCGLELKPAEVYVFRAPSMIVPYQKLDINLIHYFNFITLILYNCPGGCNLTLADWQGQKPDGEYGHVVRVKNKHLTEWLIQARSGNITKERSGVMTVQGSQRQWPHRFKPSVRVEI